MSDYIERKSIRNLYSCLNPNDRVLVGQVLIDIDAIPSAEPSWADALAELHEQFFALEKEIRRASAEMSAVIREYVDRPKEHWIPCTKSGMPLTELGRRQGEKWYGFKCSNCMFIYKGNALTECPYCQRCGADMREREGE